MSNVVQRGYIPKDEKEFGEKKSLEKLSKASKDFAYLLNVGYQAKSAMTFVGNHYLLSERQRLAVVRCVASEEHIKERMRKECLAYSAGKIAHIDGFNTIITLEVALSGSLLLRGQDGTIRDLAGLRGNYRIIDKTAVAIQYILDELEQYKLHGAVIYLDAPVSNSGKLKTLILEECLHREHLTMDVQIINEVDRVLETKSHVVSSDSIILNKCNSWLNLNRSIIENRITNCWCVDFCNNL